MAKKKTVKSSTGRVHPIVPKSDARYVIYEELVNGDAFLYQGALWIKYDVADQEAINLNTGHIAGELCDAVVEPVNITINWTQRKVTY